MTLSDVQRAELRRIQQELIREIDPYFDMANLPEGGVGEALEAEEAGKLCFQALGVATWMLQTERPFTAYDLEQADRLIHLYGESKDPS